MRHFITLLVTLISLTVASCGSGSIQESLDHAQMAMDRHDYRAARDICDHLRHGMADDESSRDATALGILSIIYMKLGESTDRDDNISYARQCYLDAYACDSDEARLYYDNLPVEDLPHISLLTSIVRSTTGSRDELPDSAGFVSENDSISDIENPSGL